MYSQKIRFIYFIMKIHFLLFLSCLLRLTIPVSAQSADYDVTSIPDSLRLHANAVVRDGTMSIHITKPDAVWITCKKVITILNPNGKDLGAIAVYYNKSRPLESISGALYDAGGKLIRKFKKSDFDDATAMQDYSLFEDNRVRSLSPEGNDYPYTIEYQYTQKYKFTLYLPDWMPCDDYGESVQQSSLNISSPNDIPIRYKGLHVSPPVIDSFSAKGLTTYKWDLSNMRAIASEPYSPPLFKSIVPIVILSPEHFNYYGMTGSYSNWKEYGQWMYEHMLKGRDKLPDGTVSYIRQLTRGLSSPEEIARKVYEYAQQKNRYVAIEIGRGGFMPMTASEVDQAGYGDCKALVNYTMALLKAVNIPSFYTEVNAGDNDISLLPRFASAGQGNHVILCVPFRKDTTWLECTNTYIPFGYLGSFTDNRNVVIYTPDGGELTRTPDYSDNTNTQKRVASFFIDSAGDLEGDINTVFKGLLYQKRAAWENLSAGDQIRRVKSAYSFLQMNVTKFVLSFIKQKIPLATENVSFSSPQYAASSGKMLTIPLNPVNRFQEIPAMVTDRKNQVYIAHGFIQTDSLCFHLPKGYSFSAIPQGVTVGNMFGEYKTQIKTEEQTLVYVRNFHLYSGIYPSSSYETFVKFLQQVTDYDQAIFMISHS